MNDSETKTPGDILIVDDMAANLRLLSLILAEDGYKVRAALSGAQALDAARAQVPDLVLLDIMMPGMDGYEVCRQLKADERTRDVPILFISALDATADKVKAFATGGVDYITKPFQSAEVLARVRTHLALRNLNRQLQAANAELARQLAELAARNEELDAFAHTVAHDIKNPLTVITGNASLLAQHYDLIPPDMRQDTLKTLERGARKMTNIVDELLLLSSVRKIEVTLEVLDMASIVNEACQRLTDLIDEYHAEIILPPAWPPVMGYAPWVEEVWINYLSNGCKYGGTPPRLELGAEPIGDGEYVRFWVQDHGDGITAEDQAILFTPFTRLNQVRARGHGLGLSIVRRIVEKLGGQAGVESEGLPGHGSRFYFTLPAAPRRE